MAHQLRSLVGVPTTAVTTHHKLDKGQMPENRLYSKPVVKTFARELIPPFVWKVLGSIIRERPSEKLEAGSERQSDYYDSQYEAIQGYHCHYADSSYFFLWCVLVDRIQPANVRCLFDIGCGPGQLALFLQDRGLQKYVGLDFSATAIRMARLVCPSYEFVREDAAASDLFNTLDYDVVVSTEFLEHVEADLEIIDRIRPGTRMYGSLPNFAHPAHVRHFNSAKEVYERYSSCFTGFRVDEFPFGSRGMSFFLFEGVRIR
jgi:SAM-dependent methyltransferase